MSSLYELASNYRAIENMAGDPDVPDEALLDTLEAIEGEIEVKAENIGKLTESWDAQIMAVDAVIRRLQARKKTLANRIASLREYLRRNMDACGISRIESPYFLFTLAKGRPKVEIVSEADLPDEYCRIRREPDKTAILAALQSGRDVPGAILGESQPSLRIK